MPASTVDHHNDLLIRMTLGDFIEKSLHAPGVDVWQDQAVEFASANIDGTKRVGVLVRQHALAKWAYRLGCPAPAHISNASKTRFVLEHQLDGLAVRPDFADFGQRFGEFFFHSC